MEMAAARGLNAANVRLMGVPDRFIEHASRQEQLVEVGLDASSLAEAMKDMIAQSAGKTVKPSLNPGSLP
jgi:1-deoxy-D-xylulose-5-phosphate synthase